MTLPLERLRNAPRPGLRRSATGIVGVALLLGCWELIGRTQVFGNTWPPLSSVWDVLASSSNHALFLGALSATTSAAAWGYLLGLAVAMAGAAATTLIPAVRDGLDRLAAVVNAIPVVALGPVFIVTIGASGAPVAMAALSVAFTMYVAATSGLRRGRDATGDVFRVLGASRWERFRRLELPSAMPAIADGLRLAAPAAVLGSVIGEWFGAPSGLGVVIVSAMSNFEITMLWAAALLTALVSLLAFGTFGLVDRLVSARFAP